MMNKVTSQFTATELTDIGRAMERNGHVNLTTFMAWALRQQSKQVLKR